MDREQVLIIEDDADIREGVRILLESENYDVKEAEITADPAAPVVDPAAPAVNTAP